MYTKLVGLVLLGLVSGFVITYAGAFLIAWLLSLFLPANGAAINGGGGDGAGLLAGIIVVFPIAFFIGGNVTGYLSYYTIESKWTLIFLGPGSYLGFLFVCFSTTPSNGFLQGICFPFGVGLLWFLSSVAGVFLGYFLRERLAKWWYGD